MEKEFKQLDYNGYLEWNGKKQQDTPAALKIKDGLCDYYIIETENGIYADLLVFKDENNLVNLHICNALKLEYDLTINLLKDKYGVVTFKQDNNVYGEELFNKIKDTYSLIDEHEERINDKFSLNSITVDLTKTK